MKPRIADTLVFLHVTAATVLGFAATDLVLPAIPALPGALGGTPAQAQYVLAAFVAGFGAGLLAFGELGARWSRRHLLAAALALLALASVAAAFAPDLPSLIALRALQGTMAAAAAAYAPGIIRAIYDERRAVRALGTQASIESLTPALAPLAGAWLLAHFSWRAAFVALAAAALPVAAAALWLPARAFAGQPRRGSYLRLLRERAFLRWALSQAFTLGGLLVLVFGAPAVIVGALGGTVRDFILMQVLGVSAFIVAAHLTPRLCARWGAERVIWAGSALSAAAALGILAYAMAGGRSPLSLALAFVPLNLGLGLRGPPGFFQAIVAAGGDDSRGAALTVLAILLTAALGTVLAAPWLGAGLAPLAAVAAATCCASLAALSIR